MVDGKVGLRTTIYYDRSTGRNCAVLTKDKSLHYGDDSYLALTLCNRDGECDRDLHYYPREAGPVNVYGRSQCLKLTVAALTPDRTRWLLPETTLDRLHCD